MCGETIRHGQSTGAMGTAPRKLHRSWEIMGKIEVVVTLV